MPPPASAYARSLRVLVLVNPRQQNLTDAAGGARSNAAQLAAPAGAISKPSIWSSWAESKVITEYEEDSDASIVRRAWLVSPG